MLKQALVVCFCALLLSIAMSQFDPILIFNTQKEHLSKTNELTLIEAIYKGSDIAKKWHPKSELIIATSKDDKEKNSNKGINGTRADWNLIFGVPNTDQSLIVSIRKDQITDVTEVKETVRSEDVIRVQEVKFNSPELVKEAIQQHDLKPGAGWGEGYHYTLLKDEDKIFVAVSGLNTKQEFTKIFYNPKNGKYWGKQVNHY